MYAVAVARVAMGCTCNCQLRYGSAFLGVGIIVRFVMNVLKAVTFVLVFNMLTKIVLCSFINIWNSRS